MARDAKIQKIENTNRSEIRNLKGHYVWWEVKNLDIPKIQLEKQLAALGYEDFVPRNDYKTALIRALRNLLKADDNDRFYRRVEEGKHAHFFVVLPKWVYDEIGVSDVSYQKELKVTINKEDGRLTFDDKKHPIIQKLRDQYREAHKFLDAQQFRTILTRIVREHCFGCSVKSHGGVYYVPECFVEELDNLRAVMNLFPDNVCMLFETPVYNDEQTSRAIEWSINNDIVDEITKLIEDVMSKDKDGKLTTKILGNRREEARNLMKKIKIHEDDLRNKAGDLEEKAIKLEQILGNKQKTPKKFDLEQALNNF
jgi:hypothetical protein